MLLIRDGRNSAVSEFTAGWSLVGFCQKIPFFRGIFQTFRELFPETKSFYGLFVEIKICALEIFQEAFAFSDHLHETTFRHKIMVILFHVFGDFFNPSGQNRDLDLRGTDVIFSTGDALNSLGFVFFSNHILIISQVFEKHKGRNRGIL